MSIDGDDGFDIELFPCSGLMAEGFRRAGVSFDVAIEIEAAHCDSYEANLGHRPLHMDARSFYQMLVDGWRPPSRVRMLVADPPCTPWSRGGKRMGTNDPRDMLEGTCRIIELLQPDVYLIGNVPGLDDGPNLDVVQRLIGGLSRHGYCTADFARLNAVFYGVPQQRIRPWWFGHRVGTPCIQWPEPTHADPANLTSFALPLAGVIALKPWLTCRDVLGHLSAKELGRPVKLRKRDSNSKQHGSVAEKPARVVGTSNLSDGNLLLFGDQPRAGKRGRRRDDRIAQGNRIGNLDEPAVTVTAKAPRKGAGAHSVFTLQPARGSDGGLGGLNTLDEPSNTLVRNTHGNASILVLNDKHPSNELDRPSYTLGSKSRDQGPHVLAVREVADSQGMRPVDPDGPSPTQTAAQRSGHLLEWNDKHAPPSMDQPCNTIRGGGDHGHSAPATVIVVSSKHPGSHIDAPALTMRATDGQGNSLALEWPWDIPSTTVQGDPRISPPGHHDENYAIRSLPGGVVISEKAAAILQGFPDFLACLCGRIAHERPWEPRSEKCPTCHETYRVEPWVFAGKTKKARFSMLGQAMPAALAHAVATSVVKQLDRTKDMGDGQETNAGAAALREVEESGTLHELRQPDANGGSEGALSRVSSAEAVPRRSRSRARLQDGVHLGTKE